MTALYTLSASELISSIASRRISAEETVRALVARVDAVDPQIHAWRHVATEAALAHAREVDHEIARERPRGSLLGVPIGIKDIFNTADMPTEMGSRIWEGFTPGNDARVVFDLRQERGTVLGKTTTSEFAVHEPTDTENPHALGYAPGTSSSGSAAAVAAGMVPWALGSQTAASIIRPASYCGIFGFKPSFGLVPRTGVLKTADTLDTVGWFSRSLQDVERLFEVCRVRGLNYPLVHERVTRKEIPRPIRIGLLRGPKWSAAEPYAQEAFLRTADAIAADDRFEVEEVDLPDAAAMYDEHDVIYCKSLSYYFRVEQRNTRDLISSILNDMLDKGEATTPERYHELVRVQAERTHAVEQTFAHDAWVTLSAGGEPPKGLRSADLEDSSKIWTYLGMPALSLPVLEGPEGLPLGLQVVAPKYADYTVLDVGAALWETLAGTIVVAEPRRVAEVATN